MTKSSLTRRYRGQHRPVLDQGCPCATSTPRSKLTQVSDGGPFPDDVPLADAVEQQRPAAEAADLETLDPDERVPTENGDTPLESNAPDWQEQHQVVETHDEDEVR